MTNDHDKRTRRTQSEATRHPSRTATTLACGLAVASTMAVGALVTDPKSTWYQELRKPNWQPAPLAFPVVWTLLYADIALISGEVLAAAHQAGREDLAVGYRRALAINLTLNAGWSVVFFGARRPHAAIPVAAALAASSADLSRRAGATDARYGVALAPYAAWTAFATVLNAAVAHLNASSSPPRWPRRVAARSDSHRCAASPH